MATEEDKVDTEEDKLATEAFRSPTSAFRVLNPFSTMRHFASIFVSNFLELRIGLPSGDQHRAHLKLGWQAKKWGWGNNRSEAPDGGKIDNT